MFQEVFPILSTADLPRALRFYQDLLGFKVTYRFPPEGQGEPDYVGLKLDQSELGIGMDPALDGEAVAPGSPAARRFALCVYTEDCDAAVERLRAAGTTVLSEPIDQPWGERMAEVADPDGNRLVLLARL